MTDRPTPCGARRRPAAPRRRAGGTSARLALAPVLLLAALAVPARPAETSAPALEREVSVAAAEQTYWPRFDPMAVPLAVYDGERTWLFRHPAPPDEFIEEDGAFVSAGRHASMVANTVSVIGGEPTATVLLPSIPEDRSLRESAAVVVHEAFHAFQGTTGRRWGADETALFLYPVDDADLLTLRRLETEALWRALASESEDDAAGWTRLALDLRARRFARLDSASVAYERGIELMEGTAAYVEVLAGGRPDHNVLGDGFAPDDVRQRAYWTGVATALLLDRLSPGWKSGFAQDDERFLDSDLDRAVAARTSVPSKSFTEEERGEAADRARADTRRLIDGRATKREAFLSKPGWSLVFVAGDAAPLWPQGFDPLNVQRVEGGILHARFLVAANEAGRIEVMDGEALTEGVGPHPLFSGIARLVVTGLVAEPRITTSDDGRLAISAPPCTAELRGARVSVADSAVRIDLPAGDARAGEGEAE